MELPRTHSCFVCGESNPLGMKLRFHAHGKEIHAEFTPRPEHMGFKGVVHGGLQATVLDEILAWACAVATGKFGYCAELTVRFQKPVGPGEKLSVRARLVENKRDRIHIAEAEIRNEAGEICSTASGKYVPIPNEKLIPMLGEFCGGSGQYASLPPWSPAE